MKLQIENQSLFLAPMAGITDTVFRTICKKMGANFVYTEFVSANGIIRENKKKTVFYAIIRTYNIAIHNITYNNTCMQEFDPLLSNWRTV